MYWGDFPEALNNEPQAEDKLQADPKLAFMNVVPSYWLSGWKHWASIKHISNTKITEVQNSPLPKLRCPNPCHFILSFIYTVNLNIWHLYVKMEESRQILRQDSSVYSLAMGNYMFRWISHSIHCQLIPLQLCSLWISNYSFNIMHYTKGLKWIPLLRLL